MKSAKLNIYLSKEENKHKIFIFNSVEKKNVS